MLPQDPQTVFVKKTVEEDLLEILDGAALTKEEKQQRIQAVADLCLISRFMGSHPYDLSGGEQQRAALAKVLLMEPQILLLDEPTKGLDAEFKVIFAGILADLAAHDVCVVMVSHDIEFCAEYTHHCALFFDGGIVSEGEPRSFFPGNSFYTTAANRMARHILPEAVTADDIIKALVCRVGVPSPTGRASNKTQITNHKSQIKQKDKKIAVADDNMPVHRGTERYKTGRLPVRRLFVAIAAVVLLIAALVAATVNSREILDFILGGYSAGSAVDVWKYTGIICVIMLSAVAVVWLTKNTGKEKTSTNGTSGHRLSKRALVAIVMIFLAIPFTIYLGMYLFDDRKYYIISMIIIIETMLPFALVFESRKPQPRELIVVAVMCAIAVVGRAAFFMLPQFKPVIAIVIITGVALGGEAGFLVGALTAFVSNMFFGQGPWTPWQMFGYGIIGFLAGVIFRNGVLAGKNTVLCVFGGIATLLIYGPIVNASNIFIFQNNPSWEMFCVALLQGLPFDLIHATATVTFLSIFSRPMLEKLNRIKTKYGLME